MTSQGLTDLFVGILVKSFIARIYLRYTRCVYHQHFKHDHRAIEGINQHYYGNLLLFNSFSLCFYSEEQSLGRGIIDLEATREEVVSKVLNAPYRRIDNEITRLSDSVAILEMHCKIMSDIRGKYRRALWKSRALNTIAGLSTCGVAGMMLTFMFPFQTILISTVAGALGTAGLYWLQTKSLDEYSSTLIDDAEMEKVFKRIYARQLAEKDEFVVSIWRRVREHLILALTPSEVKILPSIRAEDLNRIEAVLESDIPTLRRKASPPVHK